MIPNEQNSTQLITDFISSIPPYPDTYAGRGIVICAGGLGYSTGAYVCVRLLRYVGCTLPIQIYYLGQNEFDHDFASIMAEYNVEMIDATSLQKEYPHSHLGGWESKAYAILHSPYKEVLYLDADNCPILDPTYLFDTPQYKETGAIFWADYHDAKASSKFWTVHGIAARKMMEFESGQMVIDKQRCWQAINLCNWLCEYGTRFFWHYQHGDKDSYRAAWLRLDQPFSMPETMIKSLPGTMCQHDFDGRVVFQHRNTRKWSLTTNETTDGWVYEDLCLGWLDELKTHWLPQFGLPIDLTPQDKTDTIALAGHRYRYTRLGLDNGISRILAFEVCGCIGEGAMSCEKTYYVKDELLHIVGENADLIAVCEPCALGWVGRWIKHERCIIMLERVNAPA